MDPQQQPSKSQSRPHDNSTSSTFGSGGEILSSLGSTAATSTGGAQSTTTATIPSTTTSSSLSSTLLGSIVASGRNAAAALDPRQADVLRQHHSFGGGSGSSSSSQAGGGIGGSSSKGTTSSASRSFQHTTNALETLGSSSSSTIGVGSGTGYSSGFRQTTAPTSPASTGGGGMDWDSFLGSSESTVQDSAPYKPPSMASFGFSTLPDPEPASATRHDLFPQQPYQQPQQGRHQFAEAPSSSSQGADTYQAYLSQPMNLTPANHAAFLEYLKSTAYPTQQSSTSASASTTTAATTSSSATLFSSTANVTPVSATTTARPAPSQFQHQPYQPYQPYQTSVSTTARPLFSDDIQNQQHHDGGDVLSFLNSTSYSEYVDELDSAGAMIEKHQQERREFVYTYTEADLGRRSLFSTLQLIQHLPSERQDIVQYLLQQGSYAEDVWARPFSQDVRAEEGVSLDATLAEQDRFLKEQLQKREGGEGDEMEEEMERVLKEIVENAKEEVTSTGGQKDGKALNRLLMVRSHITMGTKL